MSTTVENPLTKALIEGNETEDDCPHCYGTIKMKGDWRVCGTCHTTPQGTFVPVNNDTDETNVGVIKRNEDRPRYAHSKNVILPGGFEEAHDIHEKQDELLVVNHDEIHL